MDTGEAPQANLLALAANVETAAQGRMHDYLYAAVRDPEFGRIGV